MPSQTTATSNGATTSCGCRANAGLDPVQTRLVERYYARFVRAGALLDAAAKEQMKKLNEEESNLQTRFQDNILKARSAAAILVDKKEDLDGLSEEAIAAAADAAKAKGVAVSRDAVRSGERVWSINVPGMQAPWVAGESLFVVDTGGQLMSLTRKDGRAIWTVRLPGSTIWSGPVLAGGRLWVASDKGLLVGVDGASGRIEQQINVGAPVYIAPIIAGGRMYIFTDKAKLIALQ